MPESYRVSITAKALTNLESIFDYIVQDSPQNAMAVIDRLITAIDDLELMPARFRVAGRSRKHRSIIHARVERPFIIYYRIENDARTVYLVEVRHGARRQPRRFD